MATADAALPQADLLPVGPGANLPYRLVRLFAIPVLRLAFRFEVHGGENIPRKRGGNYIVIANHLNWPDEFALLLLFPMRPRKSLFLFILRKIVSVLIGHPLFSHYGNKPAENEYLSTTPYRCCP